jgi:hypothetical protein
MTLKQLFNMKQLVRDAKTGDGGLTSEELGDLLEVVMHELYAARIKEFAEHLDNSSPSENASEQELEDFYDKDWQITFNDRTVVIKNCATVNNYITGMLNFMLESEL